MDPYLAVPPLTYGSQSYQSLYAEKFKFGEMQGRLIAAQIFTDGFGIWTNGEMSDISRISGLLPPIDSTDAASKEYVDNSMGGVPAGPGDAIQFNDSGMFGGVADFSYDKNLSVLTVNGSITGLSTPTGPSDAANKAYVDANTGTPAAPSFSIQFNDGSGSFGGTSDLIWTNGTTTLDVNGTVDANNFTGANVSVSNVTGTTLTDGSVVISGGLITGIDSLTATTVTANLFSDAAGTEITGGVVTADTFTDNVATLSGGILSDVSQIDMPIVATVGTGVITGLANPVNPYDAANKAYVDSATGTAPGLPFNSIQFNGSGIFAGDSDFTWTPATTSVLNGTLTVDGEITDGTASLLAGALSGVTTLDASGIVTFTNTTQSTNTTTGALVVSGGLGVTKDVNIGGMCYANDFNSISDRNFKENIVPLENSIDKLKDVGCFSYNLIGSDKTSYGVLAQQLETVGFSHLIRDVNDHKTVGYTNFIALLIDSVKKLDKEVTELKKFKMDYLREEITKKFEDPVPEINERKVTKKVSGKKINPIDRKTHKGSEYKYCFFCEDWTLLSNFAPDSKEQDSLKQNCKKHRC